MDFVTILALIGGGALAWKMYADRGLEKGDRRSFSEGEWDIIEMTDIDVLTAYCKKLQVDLDEYAKQKGRSCRVFRMSQKGELVAMFTIDKDEKTKKWDLGRTVGANGQVPPAMSIAIAQRVCRRECGS
jgi:hypothetical protein